MKEKPKFIFARRVRAAKPRARKYEIRDDVVTGLGLAVQPTGVRTFVLNRMVRGRRRYATVGTLANKSRVRPGASSYPVRRPHGSKNTAQARLEPSQAPIRYQSTRSTFRNLPR